LRNFGSNTRISRKESNSGGRRSNHSKGKKCSNSIKNLSTLNISSRSGTRTFWKYKPRETQHRRQNEKTLGNLHNGWIYARLEKGRDPDDLGMGS
jgi:hypothetical protein